VKTGERSPGYDDGVKGERQWPIAAMVVRSRGKRRRRGFVVGASTAETSPRGVTFRQAGIVPRETWLRVPGPEAVISLIASAFDLTAFNQMFRTPVLRRWTDAPPLLVVDRVVAFEGVNASSMLVRDEQLTDDEHRSIVDDLTWALPQLTGGTFDGFASTALDSPQPNSRYGVLTSGRITVVRVQGLTSATGFWGYSRWQWLGDRVVAGLIMLDRDFDRSGSAFRRALRTHELGHALGFNHVTGRVSVMNSSARVEPTSFDLDGARLAFSRVPGNRSPDIDPARC
jgi:hypothetical protein